MAQQIADEQIRDTDTYKFEAQWAGEPDETLYQFYNGLDQSVVIKVFGTFDGGDWSKAVQLRRMSLGSGSPTHEALSDAWDRIRFEITADASPGSGSFEIYEHAKV